MTERKQPTREKEPALKPAASRGCMEVGAAPPLVAAAIKALHAGTATPHQQQSALQWIVREAAGKAHFPYHPDPHDTAFALGRYFVADLIVGLINADLSSLRGVSNVPKSTRTAQT
jgi:hypothetical protein